MKKMKINVIFMLLFAFCSFILPPNAEADTSKISKEEAAREIVGKWQLLSFTDAGGEVTSYENENKIWTFTGQSLSVDSADLGGKREGAYRLERSIFRPINNTVIILCDELEETHLSYGKFVVISIENGTLTLSNWEDDIRYILRRVE